VDSHGARWKGARGKQPETDKIPPPKQKFASGMLRLLTAALLLARPCFAFYVTPGLFGGHEYKDNETVQLLVNKLAYVKIATRG